MNSTLLFICKVWKIYQGQKRYPDCLLWQNSNRYAAVTSCGILSNVIKQNERKLPNVTGSDPDNSLHSEIFGIDLYGYVICTTMDQHWGKFEIFLQETVWYCNVGLEYKLET